MFAHEFRFASREAVARGEIARLAALVEEFGYQANRHAEAFGEIGASAFFLIVGSNDALPQIERDGGHPPLVSKPRNCDHSFI